MCRSLTFLHGVRYLLQADDTRCVPAPRGACGASPGRLQWSVRGACARRFARKAAQPVLYVWIAVLAIVAVGAAMLAMRRQRASRRQTMRRQAVAEFDAARSALEPAFLAAASATGRPRGLSWTACRLEGAPLFAADRVSDELYALVGATVSFEAVEGGGMEDVEAVGNLRAATAVFVHRNGAWTTDGRAVFNLDPKGTLAHYHDSLAPIENSPVPSH